MKIVLISCWFSENMGYIENCITKSWVKLGHEVHVISSTAQVYYDDPNYKNVYEPFLGKNIVNEGVKQIDGYTLHRVPFGTIAGKIYFKKLNKKLREIKPDIVQNLDTCTFTTMQTAFYKPFYGYKFFTANHTVYSVFPLIQNKKSTILDSFFFFLTRTIPGRIISWVTSRCYPATIDALELAVNYYGVPRRKVKLACLGVDTDFFHPRNTNPEDILKRNQARKEFGFSENDIVVIYTGRFTEGKNPLCLAKAINKLVETGEPFKALFMGNGPQADEISKQKGCTVHKFVQYHELPPYYALADIGVWPKQESTSMLDASACGLPIIISNLVLAKERVEGNGLTYIENDIDDLAAKILQMKDLTLREKLSTAGIEKITNNYSWMKIAEDRANDYKLFVNATS